MFRAPTPPPSKPRRLTTSNEEQNCRDKVTGKLLKTFGLDLSDPSNRDLSLADANKRKNNPVHESDTVREIHPTAKTPRV